MMMMMMMMMTMDSRSRGSLMANFEEFGHVVGFGRNGLQPSQLKQSRQHPATTTDRQWCDVDQDRRARAQ
jgi:hypothetical protein